MITLEEHKRFGIELKNIRNILSREIMSTKPKYKTMKFVKAEKYVNDLRSMLDGFMALEHYDPENEEKIQGIYFGKQV